MLNLYRPSVPSASRSLIATATASALAVLLAPPVLAQQRVLEEIVVTARKAEENLQLVPVSISAFTARDIEEAGLRSVEDLALQTPGFSFRSAFGRTADRPVIRGQSNILGSPNASFFIDGVFVSGSIAGYDLDNLDRVEVIRGPQSALFGRATFAGAVNFVTRRPTNDFEGSVSGTFGSYELGELSGRISGPIIEDRLLFQLDARYYTHDGFYRNSVTGLRDVGGEETQSVGGTLYWLPTDDFEAILRVNYLRNDDEHFPISLHGSDRNNCFLPVQTGVFPGGPPFGGVPTFETRQRGYFCGTLGNAQPLALNTDGFREAGFDAGLKRDAVRTSLQLNWDLAGYQLSSISAFNETTLFTGVDVDYSGIRGAAGAFETLSREKNTRHWSQELRVLSPRDERFRWLAGLYYFKDRDGEISTGDLSGTVATGAPAVLTRQPSRGSVENQAVFAMVEFDILPDLTFTAEGRYARDKISESGRSVYNRPGPTATPGSAENCTSVPFGGGLPPFLLRVSCENEFALQETFTNFLPRFTLTWLATEEITLYGLWARGNKPGGFNTTVVSARLTPEARDQLVGQGLLTIDEEEADTIELGVKTTFLDGRGLFNLSAYYIDWTNQQLTENQSTFQEGGGSFVTSFITNLGKSEVKGFEAELRYLLTDTWDLRATYALQDSKIRRFLSVDQSDLIFTNYPAPEAGRVYGVCDGACLEAYRASGSVRGNQLPLVPKHSATFSASYRTGLPTISADKQFFFRGDYLYEGSRFVQVHNFAKIRAMHLVNFRAGLEGDSWMVTLFVNNAFNDKTPVSVLRYVDASVEGLPPPPPPIDSDTGGFNPFFPRDFAITLPDRRQIGATVTYRF
ncbi:MAG: TonB-dependent receptor [Chromatiales bacterium]|nr:TonB-dependent receptor [Chromatiales bacterium]